jgi:hypothetical protein
MTDLFKEILPSILKTKEYVLEQESDYVPFIINKALSYHDDCIFYANQMNIMFDLDKKLQYDYFINSIRAKKRSFVQWSKPEKESDLESVKMYFGYSDAKAREALKLLTDEELEMIKTRTTIGE